MDNEKNKAPLITGFLREFAAIFTLIVLSISLSGTFMSVYYPEIQNLSAIFALGRTGLPYTMILQSVGFALIIAFISRFLFSGYFTSKMSFMWRYFIFFLATLFTTSIFAILFKWFPVNNMQAWLYFFSFCFFLLPLDFHYYYLN